MRGPTVENSAIADIMNIIANNVNDTQYPRDSCSVTALGPWQGPVLHYRDRGPCYTCPLSPRTLATLAPSIPPFYFANINPLDGHRSSKNSKKNFWMFKGGITLVNRQTKSLVVQCSKHTTSFWSYRPESFVLLGSPSHSDWAGEHVQWQHGRPQQIYREHDQKCAWHRKKVGSIMVES